MSMTTTYVYGLGLILTTDSVNGTSYVLSDGLGSTTQLASTTGTVTDSYTYDVFGAPRAVTGTTANDFRFTGRQNDVNANRGLYYLRARYYDPALGRFLSKDPLAAEPGWAGHSYVYGESNPVNRTDPRGLDPAEDRKPIAVPLPAVGSEELRNLCQQKYQECTDVTAPAERNNRANDPDKYFRTLSPYTGVCSAFLARCNHHADAGESFDWNEAADLMRRANRKLADTGGNPISNFIERLLPDTGSGGYLPGARERGGTSCSP